MIGNHKQEVIYEGEGTLCTGCGRIGHATTQYTTTNTLHNKAPHQSEETTSTPKAEGWKTVIFPKRKGRKATHQMPNGMEPAAKPQVRDHRELTSKSHNPKLTLPPPSRMKKDTNLMTRSKQNITNEKEKDIEGPNALIGNSMAHHAPKEGVNANRKLNSLVNASDTTKYLPLATLIPTTCNNVDPSKEKVGVFLSQSLENNHHTFPMDLTPTVASINYTTSPLLFGIKHHGHPTTTTSGKVVEDESPKSQPLDLCLGTSARKSHPRIMARDGTIRTVTNPNNVYQSTADIHCYRGSPISRADNQRGHEPGNQPVWATTMDASATANIFVQQPQPNVDIGKKPPL
ncbi:hypothetical protein KY284_009156 [Solanum tuberosum]|nr:hypothetical protein KY284_009156 [Solanum tuberosum]